MEIELYPVVCWLNQNPALSHNEGLGAALVRLDVPAEKLRRRLDPKDLTGCSPSDLILKALQALQLKIFGQYIPALDLEQGRALGRVWPWWTAIRFEMPDRTLRRLKPLPEKDEMHGRENFEGGSCGYIYYDNAELWQRDRWVMQFMREKFKQELRRIYDRTEGETQDPKRFPAIPAFDPTRAEYMEHIKELMDTADFEAVIATSDDDPKGLAGAEKKRKQAERRKRKERAKVLFPLAEKLVQRTDEEAYRFRKLLKNAREGRRSDMLERLVRPGQ